MIPINEQLRIIQDVIRREGGFVDDPVDAGGATNWGITKKTLEIYRNRQVTVEEVKRLTIEEAAQIYLNDYIKKVGLDYISNSEVFAFCVDSAVNHGPKRVVRWLQSAVGAKPDGIIGKETKEAMLSMPEAGWNRVLKSLCAKRIRFYVEIVLTNPTQIKFLRGWIARATEFLEG